MKTNQYLITPTIISIIITTIIPLISFAGTERWQFFETKLNDYCYNKEAFCALPRTRAQARARIYEYWVPENRIRAYLNSDSLFGQNDFVRLNELTGEREFRLFVHEDAFEQFEDITQGIEGAPLAESEYMATSSPRSFFYKNKYILKLSLPKVINGANRSLYQLQMLRALSVSHLLSEIPQGEREAHHFNYLRESFAAHSASAENPFGYIVREIPPEIHGSAKTLIPAFAFFADPQEVPGFKPVGKHIKREQPRERGRLSSVFEKDFEQSRLPLAQYIEEKILNPLIDSFVFLCTQKGIALEAHQQNTLFELDEEGHLNGQIFYRDLDGARIDRSVRLKKGLSNDFENAPFVVQSGQNPEWIFLFSQVEATAHEQRSVLYHLLGFDQFRETWTPLCEHTYKTYIEDSVLFLLKRAVGKLKHSGRSVGLDIDLLARNVLKKHLLQIPMPESGYCVQPPN